MIFSIFSEIEAWKFYFYAYRSLAPSGNVSQRKPQLESADTYELLFTRADSLLMNGSFTQALETGSKAEALRAQSRDRHFASRFMSEWAGGDWVSNIGHTALGLQLLRMRSEVDNIETPILYHSSGSSNKVLINKLSEHLNINKLNFREYYDFQDKFRDFRIEMNFIKTSAGILELNEAFKYYLSYVRETLQPLSLTPSELTDVEKLLSENSFAVNKPFISFHVREKAGENVIRAGNVSDLNTLIEACIPFAFQGYQFVRMGHQGMTPLASFEIIRNLNLENSFFDYANSIAKSDLVDLYFWSKSLFFIGGDSGPVTAPILFNKPTLRINANMPFMANVGYSGYIVPKLVRNLMSGKYMNYFEITDDSVLWSHRADTQNYERVFLSPRTVENAIRDMLNLVGLESSSNKISQPTSDWIVRNKSRKFAFTNLGLPLAPSFVNEFKNLL